MGDEKGDVDSFPYFAVYFGHKKFNTIWKMPSVILSDYLATELDGPDSWPEEIVMFEPQQVSQILLYESANCLAVQTYFKMVAVELKVEQLQNTEYLTPSGRVPVVKYGSYFLTDLDRIVSLLKEKGKVLNDGLDDEKRADMRTYMSLVNNQLLNDELYLCWADEVTYSTVTSKRYGSVYPWPLNHILTWRKRRHILEKLEVLKMKSKTINEILRSVSGCMNNLSVQLGDRPWFYGNKPTELDALVFGHLFTILTTPLPDSRLSEIVNSFPNLVAFCKRVEENYFEKTAK